MIQTEDVYLNTITPKLRYNFQYKSWMVFVADRLSYGHDRRLVEKGSYAHSHD